MTLAREKRCKPLVLWNRAVACDILLQLELDPLEMLSRASQVTRIDSHFLNWLNSDSCDEAHNLGDWILIWLTDTTEIVLVDLSLTQLESQISEVKKDGLSIVFTNGVFDILHAGHVHYLQETAALADFFIIGLPILNNNFFVLPGSPDFIFDLFLLFWVLLQSI